MEDKLHHTYNESHLLHELKHFLPAQAPLKDFVHHNTLHAFQDKPFFEALHEASTIFGYKVSLTLSEYRQSYASGKVHDAVVDKVLTEKMGISEMALWKERLLHKPYDTHLHPRIGNLRNNWKRIYHFDLDSQVHPLLFRVLCNYLDQGVSMWHFPASPRGFLSSLREVEKNSYTSLFKEERPRHLLLHTHTDLEHLLEIIVGDKHWYNQYLFDQQFAHQGWSGMVSAIEDHPESLLDHRRISLHDLIVFELLLEIDALDHQFKKGWEPLAKRLKTPPLELFAPIEKSEYDTVMELWQQVYEWSYYDQVLAGIQTNRHKKQPIENKSLQAIFCIDDRECSLRRYIEKFDVNAETFGTPGFFNLEFYYQPHMGKFYTKLCPAPVTPKYLIKEIDPKIKHKKDAHLAKDSLSLLHGLFYSLTLGFVTAFELLRDVFRPSMTEFATSSFRHMGKRSTLTFENEDVTSKEKGLQIGFTVAEMADRMEGLFKSIGLVKDFAPVVYIIGHGASSANNPHFSAYDCGACCGRPGSVNARAASLMVNHPKVREILAERGIVIPKKTQFIGGLHDTTRDDMQFYDVTTLTPENLQYHLRNDEVFTKSLAYNAKERSRRFESVDSSLPMEKVHQQVRLRSVSLYEPRPELNHATNALCIVGRRAMTRGLFLDRRSFMNSYDYALDPEGKYLFGILKAAAPVCGGINLEYYFSRVDNQKLGAGTKLPHNVMGLFGVANGIDGDLRPGLPSQMIELHDPLRLLMVVEHFPEVVLKTIQSHLPTYEWFANDWIHLVVVHPEHKTFYRFKDGEFKTYVTASQSIKEVPDIMPFIYSHRENLPVLSFPE